MANNVSVEINLSIRMVYDPMTFQNAILVHEYSLNKQAIDNRQQYDGLTKVLFRKRNIYGS